MKRLLYPAVLVICLVLSGTSCRKVYLPGELEDSEHYLHISGRILEDSVPIVILRLTAGYLGINETPVEGANVTIEDEKGKTVTLYEQTAKGRYTTTEDDFRGKPGSTYTLSVVTSEGNTYFSNPVTMPSNPEVQSFHLDPSIQKTYRYTASGKLVTSVSEGMAGYTEIVSDSPEEKYYRFRTRVITQIVFTKWPGSFNATTGYKWTVGYADDIYNIGKTVLYQDEQVVLGHQSGFLEPPQSILLEIEDASWPIFAGWVVTHRVFAISSDVYEYYESIAEQLTPDNEIFSPVPSRIKSNVFSETAPVIGVFEASSFSTFHKGCMFYDKNNYYSFDIPYYPENVSSGDTLHFPPYTWINVFNK